jgi:plasmid stabilization system protein ParE
MTHEPVWRAAAREDLADAIAWYAEQSLRVAERFAITVDSTVTLMLENPNRYPFSSPDFRWAKGEGVSVSDSLRRGLRPTGHLCRVA